MNPNEQLANIQSANSETSVTQKNNFEQNP
jgi:hypothetical protein